MSDVKQYKACSVEEETKFNQRLSESFVLLADYETLKAENESLRADAERYRWIKGNASVMLKKTAYFTSGTSYIGTVYPKESDLDTAIDVSMANDSPENPS